MTTLAEKLRAEPGIDVRRLKVGTYVFVETAKHVYEMKVVLPHAGLLEITSSDPPLHVAHRGAVRQRSLSAGLRRGRVDRQRSSHADPLSQRLLHVGPGRVRRGRRREVALRRVLMAGTPMANLPL